MLQVGYSFSPVTRSSQLTIPHITPMATRQITRKTAQHIHSEGILLSITGPIQINRLPSAVAPSHKPWQIPCRCLGAILDTNDRPSGEMNNSATVRKK